MLISTENTEDFWAKLLSLPSWERGLKRPIVDGQEVEGGRSPRGSVD